MNNHNDLPFGSSSNNGAHGSETPSPIPLQSDIPHLRDVYEQNQLSFLHRLPAEIRNRIMEYSVTLSCCITPVPIDKYPSVNRFTWGLLAVRRGMLAGLHAEIHFPTGGPLAVVSLQQTCRQFYHELDGVFYRINTFMFLGVAQCERYLKAITMRKRRQVRKICLSFPRDCFLDWAKTPNTAVGDLGPKLGLFPKVLLTNCPLLERFIVELRDRPSSYRITEQGGTSRTYREGSDVSFYNSFGHQQAMCREAHGDKDRKYTLRETARYMRIIGRLLDNENFRNSTFAIPQLEFYVPASKSIRALVSGKLYPGWKPTTKDDLRRKFELDTAWANEKMWQFREHLLKSSTSKLPSNFIWADSDRLLRGSVPDVARFRLAHPLRGAEPQIPQYVKFDANGLIIWEGITPQIINIFWEGSQIKCYLLVRNPHGLCRFHTLSIERFASYEGIRTLARYFLPSWPVRSKLTVLRTVLENLTIYPSPRDINKVLLSTGRLDLQTAPPDISRNWIHTLISRHDERVESIKRHIAKWEKILGD
ncbi:hypothetical protein F5Y08DRAFT_348752 [Xylaria arbuscula]|nr:hypothetical protein F5Y08DRAFT_348752 [Xylaria arbuscula]